MKHWLHWILVIEKAIAKAVAFLLRNESHKLYILADMIITFIVHGQKIREQKFRDMIASYCLNNKDEFSSYFTAYSGHATELTQTLGSQTDILVVVGGDGLLHECINGVMTLSERPVVVLWPFGSGNDFARNFGWRNEVADVFRRIFLSGHKLVDVGEIKSEGNHAAYFINEMSIGLGPAVVNRVLRYPESWNGNIKFGLGVISTFLNFRKPKIKMHFNNQEYESNTMAVVVANGKYFGSGIGISPEADVSDGRLNLTIIGDVSIADYIVNLRKLRSCIRLAHAEVKYDVLESLKIFTVTAVEADGQLIDSNGIIEIQIHHRAIRMR